MYHSDRRSNISSPVRSPLAGSTKSLDITNNILGDGSPSFGRHQAQRSKESTKFWGDCADKRRDAKNRRSSVAIIENLRCSVCQCSFTDGCERTPSMSSIPPTMWAPALLASSA